FGVNNGGNQDIYVMTMRDRQLHRMTSHAALDAYFAWSPDGKQIVFASERSGDREIWIMPVDKGDSEAKQLTRSRGSDDDPTFTPDGRVVFDSVRGGTQDIWIMDADGGNPRVLFGTPAFEQVARVSPDGQWVVFESIPDGSTGKPDLRFGSIDGGDSMSIGNGNAPFFSADGEFIIYESEVAGGTTLVRVKNPKAVAKPEIIPLIANIEKTQKQQFEQLADEAFNALKSGYYDPGFNGRDWDKIRARYAPVIGQAETTEEMANLLNRAIGELGSSHMGYYASSDYSRANSGTGRLGATTRMVNLPGEGSEVVRALEVVDTIPGGPADKIWLRKGDLIRAVNGKPVQHVNFYRMLTGQRAVMLTVSSASNTDDTRDVQVELANDGQIRQLEYQAWESRNQKAVAEAGKDMAYVHLTGMNPENLQKIVAYLTGPGANKDGLVLDVRNNGGGHLHNQLMDIFNRQPFGQYRPRNGKEAYEPGLTWNKPVVLLINEHSFSDAEVFPAAFRAVNRGPIIGRRTPGGVIGTRDIQLSDGSTLRVPTVGWFRMNGENMEGNGQAPDIDVPLGFQDQLDNADPQLERAIQALREEMNKAKAAGKPEDGPGGATDGSGDTRNN
ncbi:MAG: S41 family peptidase, partial [Planctomycetota bacterium]